MGVSVVGVGFSDPTQNAQWADTMGYGFELWTDSDRALSLALGTIENALEEAPDRDSFVIDPQGRAILAYRGAVSLGADPADVLADCQLLYGEE